MSMLKKITLIGVMATLAGQSYATAPTVTNVTMSQDEVTRTVKITYDLGEEPGIVTFDICTNGVSIGASNILHAVGDVNRKLEVGAGKEIYWPAEKSWPGHAIKEACVTAVVTAWSTNNPPPVLVVDLVTTNKYFYNHISQLPDGGLTNRVYKTEKLVMKRIPAAGVTWVMGDSVSASPTDQFRPHHVSFSEDFYLGVFEVTQRQMELGSGRARNTFTNFAADENADVLPAEKIGYGQISGSSPADMQLRGYNKWPADVHTIAAGSAILSKFRLFGLAFDLPTSAQWEYACRAGCATDYNNGTNDNLDVVGWYSGNSAVEGSARPHPVGSKRPNAFGLYDMHGNVSEWVLDWYDSNGSSIVDYDINPKGLAAAQASPYNTARTWRGGSYNGSATASKAYVYGNRNWNATLESGFGFRLWAPVGVQ